MREVNRRRVERYALAPGFEAVLDEFGAVKLIDLSVLGARVQRSEPVERGLKVKLRFKPHAHAITIQLSGTVVWSERLVSSTGELHSVGIEFEQEAQALRTALDQLCRSGGARRL